MSHPTPTDPVAMSPPAASRPFEPDNMRGILWIMVSVVATSALTLIAREMSGALDPRMIVLLRFGLTGCLLLIGIATIGRLRRQLRFSRPSLHLLRGIFMGVSSHLGFYAIANIDLVTATVLFFTVPIFVAALAGIVNGEKTGPRRIAAIAISFAGVLLILQPGIRPFEPAMAAALASSILFALALVMARRVAQADGTFSVLVSSVIITVLVSVPLAVPVWKLPDSNVMWLLVAGLVTTGLVRLLADIQAYRIGEAGVLAPFTYLRLVFIGVGAFVFYAEVPDPTALIGAAIIIGASLYIAHREAQIRKRSSTAAKQ